MSQATTFWRLAGMTYLEVSTTKRLKRALPYVTQNEPHK